MTEQPYELNRWYPWTGGARPVDYKTRGKVKLKSGSESSGIIFGALDWSLNDPSPIIAFCVTSYPPKEKRVDCYRCMGGTNGEFGTCIMRDGEVDWSTWEPKE